MNALWCTRQSIPLYIVSYVFTVNLFQKYANKAQSLIPCTVAMLQKASYSNDQDSFKFGETELHQVMNSFVFQVTSDEVFAG